MAEWTTTLGASDSDNAVQIQWVPPEGDRLIDQGIVVGGATAYLRQLSLRDADGQCVLRTDETDLTGGSTDGPQLVPEFEESETGLTFSAAGLSLTLPGPNHPSNLAPDPVEQYLWRIPTARGQDASDFIAGWRALSAEEKANTTVTMRDFTLVRKKLVGSAQVERRYIGSTRVRRVYVGSDTVLR